MWSISSFWSMRKAFFYVLSTLTAALLAGWLPCKGQEIPQAAADSSSAVTAVLREKSSEDWLKAKLDSLRLSTPQPAFRLGFTDADDSTGLQRRIVEPAVSPAQHGPEHEGYTEKLFTVRALQDSVYMLKRKLESMQKRLDNALNDIQRIEMEFLSGE